MGNTKIKISIDLSKRTIFLFLITLILFGGAIRLTAAYSEVHWFDLPYYLDWAQAIEKQGLFSVYATLKGQEHAVDYPPLFLFPLVFTGKLLNNNVITSSGEYLMIVLKTWQILFDLAIIPLLYFTLKKYNEVIALLAASLWAVNPAAVFSSAYWGQTDSLMIFMLLAVFAAFDASRPVAGTVLFALACLTKFQCAYFAPVVILVLFFGEYKLKQSAIAIGAAAGVAIAVFFPFMLHSGITLPFDVYFGGFGKWPYADLFAFNLFGALGMNYIPDTQGIPFLRIPAGVLGNIFTILAVAAAVVFYFTSKKRCPFVIAFFLMNSIFMLASRMHERYQIPVLIFLLFAAAKHKNLKLFVSYLVTSLMVYLNTAIVFKYIVYADNNPPSWSYHMDTILTSMSLTNLAVYLATTYIVVDFLYGTNRKIADYIKSRRTNKGEPLENDD